LEGHWCDIADPRAGTGETAFNLIKQDIDAGKDISAEKCELMGQIATINASVNDTVELLGIERSRQRHADVQRDVQILSAAGSDGSDIYIVA
jgi:hypothetical protein